MKHLISICIPTYKRPAILRQALQSCLEQTYQPIEIVISDDSPDDKSEQMVNQLQRECSCDIRYFRNDKALGQAGNVNNLFDLARGERLVLLHDDDLLLPNALSDLARCWDVAPDLTAAYGKQHRITNEGARLPGSDEINAAFLRPPSPEMGVLSAMEAALMQQFPNDGYLIQTAVARRVRYREQSEVGTMRWCDYDFGIRLAIAGSKFCFLNQYTAVYRITDEAVSKQGYPTYMFPLIEKIDVEEGALWAKNKALQRLAPTVIKGYLIDGKRSKARKIYLSRYYRARERLTMQGLFLLVLLLAPGNKVVLQWEKRFARSRSRTN